MKLSIPAGTTSKRIAIFIQDSTSTSGAGLTGLAFNTASLVCYSWIDTDGNAGGTVQALQTATLGTWTTRGFKEKDATNLPGFYEFGIPDALLASGVKWAILMFKSAANMAPLPLEIEVTTTSNQDGVRGGMTALPNAAANAAGGLPVSSAGGLDLDEMNVDIEAIQTSTAALTFTVANQVDVNVLDWKSATAPAMTGDAFARLGAPAGASVSADVAAVKVDTAAVKVQTDKLVFSVTNQVDANPLSWKSGTIPAPNVTGVPLVDLKYTLGTISPATAGSVRADAVTGAVGSVTGAVGSVTGAVGSVTGAVGSIGAGGIAASSFGASAIDSSALAVSGENAIADALLDRVNGIETSYTLRQSLRLMLSALAAKLSGAATATVSIRDVGDTKNRIVATVDASGNRSAVTLDGS